MHTWKSATYTSHIHCKLHYPHWLIIIMPCNSLKLKIALSLLVRNLHYHLAPGMLLLCVLMRFPVSKPIDNRDERDGQDIHQPCTKQKLQKRQRCAAQIGMSAEMHT